jgi:hypothetical protein
MQENKKTRRTSLCIICCRRVSARWRRTKGNSDLKSGIEDGEMHGDHCTAEPAPHDHHISETPRRRESRERRPY